MRKLKLALNITLGETPLALSRYMGHWLDAVDPEFRYAPASSNDNYWMSAVQALVFRSLDHRI